MENDHHECQGSDENYNWITDPMRTAIRHKFEQTNLCVFKLEEGVMLWLKITPTY